MSAILTQRQLEHAERLRNDPFFVDNGITVLTEDLKDIENQVDIAVGRLGLCVIVTTPTAGGVIGQFQPIFKDIRIVGRVLEHVTINRAKAQYKAALEVAEHVAALWHGFITDSDQNTTGLDEGQAIALAVDPVCLAYDVMARTAGGISYAIPKLAAPTINIVNGLCTLTGSGTPGEAIFYTLDKKRPAPRHGTLYTVPFATGPLDTVKAQAFLAGYNPSDVATAAP